MYLNSIFLVVFPVILFANCLAAKKISPKVKERKAPSKSRYVLVSFGEDITKKGLPTTGEFFCHSHLTGYCQEFLSAIFPNQTIFKENDTYYVETSVAAENQEKIATKIWKRLKDKINKPKITYLGYEPIHHRMWKKFRISLFSLLEASALLKIILVRSMAFPVLTTLIVSNMVLLMDFIHRERLSTREQKQILFSIGMVVSLYILVLHLSRLLLSYGLVKQILISLFPMVLISLIIDIYVNKLSPVLTLLFREFTAKCMVNVYRIMVFVTIGVHVALDLIIVMQVILQATMETFQRP